MATRANVIVIGDSYMSSEVFREAATDLGIAAEFRTVTACAHPSWPTASLREFEGDPAEVSGLIDGHRAIVVHGAPITREVLEAHPSVRLVACARGGPVNVDVEAAAELGVHVATSPGKNALAVAELTIGFIISATRHLPESAREIHRALDEQRSIAENPFEGAQWFGRELSGLRLGLIGFGRVARLVASRAAHLGMDVGAYDPYVTPEHPALDMFASLESLLHRSDVVSVHARETPENRHLINERTLALLPHGAILINTARESLVDEDALLDALTSGQLHGAALDVCEAHGRWRELARLPQVQITPHLGGATHETLRRGAQIVLSTVAEFLADEGVSS